MGKVSTHFTVHSMAFRFREMLSGHPATANTMLCLYVNKSGDAVCSVQQVDSMFPPDYSDCFFMLKPHGFDYLSWLMCGDSFASAVQQGMFSDESLDALELYFVDVLTRFASKGVEFQKEDRTVLTSSLREKGFKEISLENAKGLDLAFVGRGIIESEVSGANMYSVYELGDDKFLSVSYLDCRSGDKQNGFDTYRVFTGLQLLLEGLPAELVGSVKKELAKLGINTTVWL